MALGDEEEEMINEVSEFDFTADEEAEGDKTSVETLMLELLNAFKETLYPQQENQTLLKKISDISAPQVFVLSNAAFVDDCLRSMGLEAVYDNWCKNFLQLAISKGRKSRGEAVELVKAMKENLQNSEQNRFKRMLLAARSGLNYD